MDTSIVFVFAITKAHFALEKDIYENRFLTFNMLKE